MGLDPFLPKDLEATFGGFRQPSPPEGAYAKGER